MRPPPGYVRRCQRMVVAGEQCILAARHEGPHRNDRGDSRRRSAKPDPDHPGEPTMTATTLLALNNVGDLRREAGRLWTEGNNAGEGFAPENDDVNDAGEGQRILHAATNTDVAIYRQSNGDVVLVGDAHGAWAVRVRA